MIGDNLTDEIIGQIGKHAFDSLLHKMDNLEARWRHEKEYEDFEDYIKVMVATTPEGCEFVKMTSRPFRVEYKLPNKKPMFIKVTKTAMTAGLVA